MEIKCLDVSYSYALRGGDALRGVTCSIGRGVTGLLGPNGAGKSTLMSILATLTQPRSGSVTVDGRNTNERRAVDAVRAQLGYLPQHFDVMPGSSVMDNVAYSAWAHGVEPESLADCARAALQSVDLLDRPTLRARKLSGGQRQRLGIACAIAHRPSLVILDEPTVGVDPLQRLEVRRVIETLGATSTVLVSTHLVEDISRMASHLLVLHRGSLLYAGSCDEFAARAQRPGLDRSVAIEDAFAALVGAA